MITKSGIAMAVREATVLKESAHPETSVWIEMHPSEKEALVTRTDVPHEPRYSMFPLSVHDKPTAFGIEVRTSHFCPKDVWVVRVESRFR